MTDKQKIVEGWAHELLRAGITLEPTKEQTEELFELIHMARLGAWYYKHQVIMEHLVANTLTVMEASHDPAFYPAIEQLTKMREEKPQN